MSNFFIGLFKNVYAIQTIQLPIVISIILFTITAIRRKPNRSGKGHSRMLPTDNFLWIMMGFIFNLLYLLVLLLPRFFPTLLNAVSNNIISLLLDFGASTFFFIASWYKQIFHGKRFRYLPLIFPISILVIVLYVTDFSDPKLSPLLLIYNSLCLAWTARIFSRNNKQDDEINGNVSTHHFFIALGFLAWAFIHMVAYYMFYIVKANPVVTNGVGFMWSTVAKMLILYGFFEFYVNLANHIMKEKLDDQESIHNLIDTFLYDTNVSEINSLLGEQLRKGPVFSFDYVIMLRVDYLAQKIVFYFGYENNEEIKSIPGFIGKEGIDLEGNHELIKICRDRRIEYLKGTPTNTMLGTGLYVPMIRPGSPDIQDIEDKLPKVIGILILGFNDDKVQDAYLNKGLGRALLKIYVKQVAQPFTSTFNRDIRKIIDAILRQADQQSGNDFKQYLELIVIYTFNNISADDIALCLFSLNNNDRLKGVELVSPRREADTNRFPAVILEKALEKPAEPKSFFRNGKDPLEGVYDDFSHGAIVISYEKKVLGYVRIKSKRKNYFNEDNIYLLNKVFERVGENYVKKKAFSLTGEYLKRDKGVNDFRVISKSVIGLIVEYFNAKYASLWIREYNNNNNVIYSVFEKSEAISRDWPTYGTENFEEAKGLKELRPIPPALFMRSKTNTDYWRVLIENQVRTVIFVPLKIDQQQYGFIAIYSMRENWELFQEDEQFLKLIADKTVLSFINSEIIKSFSSISESYTDQRKWQVLRTIAQNAVKTLHSEPVIIYPVVNNQIDYTQVAAYGLIDNPNYIRMGRPHNFSLWAIQNGEDGFYSSEDFLPKQYVREGGFWKRERIKSMAAIPLIHVEDGDNRTVVGLMYFNYRQERKFSDQIIGLIKAFSTLATSALMEFTRYEDMRIENIKMRAVADEAVQKSEKVADEFEKKLVELLPVANAASLAQIVRAVNHDIRNHLFDISGLMHDIKLLMGSSNQFAAEKDELSEHLVTINSVIDNSTNLVQLFAPNSFKISNEDLRVLAGSVVMLCSVRSKTKSDNIIIEIVKRQDDIPAMRCVKAEISMILYNLINNAKDAISRRWEKDGRPTGIKGTVKIDVNYSKEERYYIIVVEDDGIGIDNGIVNRIYESDYTTKEKGLGIGLYFVKNTLEENYSGTIHCTSERHQGTKFEMKFKQHKK